MSDRFLLEFFSQKPTVFPPVVTQQAKGQWFGNKDPRRDYGIQRGTVVLSLRAGALIL
jgi:hypothetical protein